MSGRRFCCSANVRALAGALFCFTFCGAACHKPASSANRLTTSGPLKPCKLPGIDEELLCGKLTVFENRETRSGRTIDLNVVVVPALDSSRKEEPLFDLAGGPGVAATVAADFYAKEGKGISSPSRRSPGGSTRHGRLKSIDGGAEDQEPAGLSHRDVSGGICEDDASSAGTKS